MLNITFEILKILGTQFAKANVLQHSKDKDKMFKENTFKKILTIYRESYILSNKITFACFIKDNAKK